MFLLDIICDIARYADGNISYTSNVYEDLVINKTENFSGDLFKQFRENHLKANPDKCHLLNSTNKSTNLKTITSIAAMRKNYLG